MTRAEILAVKELHTKRGREQQGLFICEGMKLVEEVIASKFNVGKIYTLDQNLPNIASGAEGLVIEKISRDEMSRISSLKTPTSILATVAIPQTDPDEIIGESLKLVLDGVQDPGNLGTIIRIADWFGIRRIYCSQDSADCFNPKVVQATMGAITRVSVRYMDIVSLLGASSEPVYGTFLDGENIYDAQLECDKGFVVMGSEGRGVSAAVEELISSKLFIPPFPTGQSSSESLNVAVATAIVCSEFRRRGAGAKSTQYQ